MSSNSVKEAKVSVCTYCGEFSIWINGKMIYPDNFAVEPPNQDLSDEIKQDYLEAASIWQKSPRGAAALLRLALQKLMIQLGEKGENLNEDIANLVKKGLDKKIQQALDYVRVIGNNAVHPGLLDLRDNKETVGMLFELINFIADRMITSNKKIDELYDKLPDSIKQQIEKRDKGQP